MPGPLSPVRLRGRRVLVALLGCMSLALAGVPSPAGAAAPGPAFAPLDTSTPGHVTGTLTSASSYVRVQLETTVVQTAALPVVNGTASFDLPTWGFRAATLRAVGCSGTAPDTCTTEITESVPFTTHDVTPTVTWPTDASIQHDQQVTITTSDPQGGGQLRVVWVPDASGQAVVEQDIARDATTTLTKLASRDLDGDGDGDDAQVGDSPGRLVLKRCRASFQVDPYHCRILLDENGADVEKRLQIDHSTYATGQVTPYTNGPGAQTIKLGLALSDPGSYRLTWGIADWYGAQTAFWENGVQDFVATDTSAIVDLPWPGQHSAGAYVVVASLERTTEHGNAFVNQVYGSSGGATRFDIDGTGPMTGQLQTPYRDLFPATDGYRDTVPLTLTGQYEPWTDVTLTIRNSAGKIVHTQNAGDDAATADGSTTFTPWNGRDGSGAIVAPGYYDALAVAHDASGNASSVPSTLYVNPAKLTKKTWSQTVTAAASRVATSAGRCSAVVAPASRSWAQSLMLASGYRCAKGGTGAELTVGTTHQVTVPTLPAPDLRFPGTGTNTTPGRYDTIAVTTYGGASVPQPRSVATVRYLTTAERADGVRVMTSALGNHAGFTRSAAGLVRSNRAFRWNTFVTTRNRYDLKHFVVTLSYTALQ